MLYHRAAVILFLMDFREEATTLYAHRIWNVESSISESVAASRLQQKCDGLLEGVWEKKVKQVNSPLVLSAGHFMFILRNSSSLYPQAVLQAPWRGQSASGCTMTFW